MEHVLTIFRSRQAAAGRPTQNLLPYLFIYSLHWMFVEGMDDDL